MPDDPLTTALLSAMAISGGLFLFSYLVGPALIRLMTVQNADAQPEEFDPAETPPPRPVRRFWDEAEEDLSARGFEREAHLAVHGLVPNVSMLVAVFANRETHSACLATFAYARPAGGGFSETQRAFEFGGEFDSQDSPDGVLDLGVVNSGDAVTFPRDPARCRRLPCEWLTDPAELARVHDAVCREWGAGLRRRPLPPPDGWEAAVRRDLAREQAEYRENGHFERVRNGRRAMTWSGAYRATWKLLPPVKQILRARRQSAAKARLRAWGLEELT